MWDSYMATSTNSTFSFTTVMDKAPLLHLKCCMGTQWEYSSNLMGVYFDVSIGIKILKDLLSGGTHVIIMTFCYSHVTVLIPSSSSLLAASIAGQNNPTQCNESILSPLLTGTSLAFGCDPLSIPSGFTNGNKPTDVSPPLIIGHICP